jgi:hypothetical protein
LSIQMGRVRGRLRCISHFQGCADTFVHVFYMVKTGLRGKFVDGPMKRS